MSEGYGFVIVVGIVAGILVWWIDHKGREPK